MGVMNVIQPTGLEWNSGSGEHSSYRILDKMVDFMYYII